MMESKNTEHDEIDRKYEASFRSFIKGLIIADPVCVARSMLYKPGAIVEIRALKLQGEVRKAEAGAYMVFLHTKDGTYKYGIFTEDGIKPIN